MTDDYFRKLDIAAEKKKADREKTYIRHIHEMFAAIGKAVKAMTPQQQHEKLGVHRWSKVDGEEKPSWDITNEHRNGDYCLAYTVINDGTILCSGHGNPKPVTKNSYKTIWGTPSAQSDRQIIFNSLRRFGVTPRPEWEREP